MIEITQAHYDKVATLLEGVPKGAERALTNAINRALSKAKTTAYKGVQEEYAIKRSVLTKYTEDSIKKASVSDICGELIFSGVQIPLYKYSLTNPTRPGRARVTAGQKTAKVFENAFIAEMKNTNKNHTGIFERVGKSAYPIREVMGSSMRSMASNTVVMEEVYKETQKTLDERIDQEINRLLAGYGG